MTTPISAIRTTQESTKNPGGFCRALLMTFCGANVRENNIRRPTDNKEGLAGNVGVTMRQRTSEA